MAQHVSAEKRSRRTKRRTAINNARLNRLRSFVKKVETAIARGDRKEAEAALRAAQPELHKRAADGTIHRNTASRKLSRLSARIKALGAAAR